MRYVSSTQLQLHGEATAMCGGYYEAKRSPELHAFFVRHLRETKAEQLAKSETRRMKREARWTAMLDGRLRPVSIFNADRFDAEELAA